MTELIWDGKYVDGKKQSPVRVALPFQTIETVNESAADRQRTKIELGAKYTYAEPGKYRIVVKVIDILGNDTTKPLEVTVK
jgi:hypothetical protein